MEGVERRSTRATKQHVAGRSCRVCGQRSDKCVDIFANELESKIHAYLPIKVARSDEACSRCVDTLLSWHSLFQLCVRVNASLGPTATLAKINDESDKKSPTVEKCPTFCTGLQDLQQFDDDWECNEKNLPDSQIPTVEKKFHNEPNTERKIENSKQNYLNFKWVPDLKNNPTPSTSKNIDEPKKKRLMCRLCGKKFLKEDLKQHMKTAHFIDDDDDDNDDAFKTLESKALNNIGMKQHIIKDGYCKNDTDNRYDPEIVTRAKVTIGDRVHYKCPMCDTSLLSLFSFLHHLMIHNGTKPYACRACDAKFRTPTSLRQHVQFKHDNVKRFRCDTCNRAYHQKQALIVHIRTHTGERPYLCTICGKRFSQSGSLLTHRKYHTNDCPYACAECGRRFRVRWELKHHAKSHTDERTFACEVCGNTYKYKKSLKNHLLLHADDKPFKCTVCARGFRNSSYVNVHMRKCHGIGSTGSRYLIKN